MAKRKKSGSKPVAGEKAALSAVDKFVRGVRTARPRRERYIVFSYNTSPNQVFVDTVMAMNEGHAETLVTRGRPYATTDGAILLDEYIKGLVDVLALPAALIVKEWKAVRQDE